MPFFSHSIPGQPPESWPYLRCHLTTTAHEAHKFGSAFGSGEWAFLCGLLHDLGKYSLAFQKRLHGGKKVDHSLAGALEAIRFLESRSCRLFNPLAHIISGHHTGLADGIPGETDDSSLKARLRAKDAIPDYSAWQQEIALPENVPLLPSFTRMGKADLAFSVFFWTRMLYSCLVDADFLHTESVKAPEKADRRGEYPAIAALHEAFNAYMVQKTAAAKLKNVNDQRVNVNEQRARVLAACREAALLEQGLFSLTVPTGGGKTLSSLAFALAHADKHSLQRIIYVIPYTSIIEQTADEFRKAFGADFAYAVIEHHSNVKEKVKEEPAEADQHEDLHTLAFENWDAPIIVTTAAM
jgi:CRISPR-associated endonuclease/helicase Cas3